MLSTNKQLQRNVAFAICLTIMGPYFLFAQDRRPSLRRIQLQPILSEPVKLSCDEKLLVLLKDSSLLVLCCVHDPLVPQKRGYHAVWKLSSLSSYKSILRANGPDEFASAIKVPDDAQFSWKTLELYKESFEAVSDCFGVSIRTDLDQDHAMLSIQKDLVDGYRILKKSNLVEEFPEDSFIKLQ